MSKRFINLLSKVTKPGKAKIITVTEADKFIKKTNRPEHLNNLRKLTTQVVSVGYSYGTLIENRLKKADIPTESFEKTECRFSDKFSENGIVRVSKKDEEQFYVRYYLTGKTHENTVYINELDEIVEISKKDKEEFFTKKSSSKKQYEAGIENEVKVRTVKLDNLHYFQKGKRIFNKLSDKALEVLGLELEE